MWGGGGFRMPSQIRAKVKIAMSCLIGVLVLILICLEYRILRSRSIEDGS